MSGRVTLKDVARYRAAIRYLERLARSARGPDYMRDHSRPHIFLERTRWFLCEAGVSPSQFKVIHVTGTSGKGTVTNMVHEVLKAAGKRVGSFTSPYSVTATENIKVGNQYIAPGEFADIVAELKPLIEGARRKGPYGRPTYFEIIFGAALIYFARMRCEWVVLEVGMGGLYDATNVVECPVVTAITNIGFDHMQVLGRSLTSIARNKAGIIKPGAQFFTTETRASLRSYFRKECQKKGGRFTSVGPGKTYVEANRNLVRAIGTHVGMPMRAIQAGIQAARLPCRFEIVQKRPLVILDGAHNPSKMETVAFNLRSITYERLHLVLAVNATKDAARTITKIVPCADRVYVTTFRAMNAQSHNPRTLARLARRFARKNVPLPIFPHPEAALDAALRAAHKKDLVLVTGSFYLAGDLRRRWFPEGWVLMRRRSFRKRDRV